MEIRENEPGIGKAFKEKFEDFSETPNPKTWENIKNSIFGSKVLTLRYSLGGALVLAIVGIGIFFMQTKEKTVETSKIEREGIIKTSESKKSNYRYPVEFHLNGLNSINQWKEISIPSEIQSDMQKMAEENVLIQEKANSVKIIDQNELIITDKEKTEKVLPVATETILSKPNQNFLPEGQTTATGTNLQAKPNSAKGTITSEKTQTQVKFLGNPESTSIKSPESPQDHSIEIWVPSAFTPGEASNNVFKPSSSNVTKFEMVIYNRGGQKVFESKDINLGWDGTFKGSLAPLGAYVYMIQCTNANGVSTQKTGTINLIR